MKENGLCIRETFVRKRKVCTKETGLYERERFMLKRAVRARERGLCESKKFECKQGRAQGGPMPPVGGGLPSQGRPPPTSDHFILA